MYVDVTIIQLHLIIIIIIVTRRQQRPRLRIASRSKKNESSDNTKRVLLSLILYPVSKKKQEICSWFWVNLTSVKVTRGQKVKYVFCK